MTIELPQWLPPTSPSVLWLVLAVVSLFLLVSWLVGRHHYRERGKQFIHEFENSTISHAVADIAPTPAGFVIRLDPAPDPFVGCHISYRTQAAYNPLAWALQLLSPPLERLFIQSNLPSAPEAELIWYHDRAPAIALGRSQNSALWTKRRLDFVDAEYVTRGPLTNGVRHVFAELQTRYGPFLQQVVVHADADPQLTIVLDTARFDPGQSSKLLALVLAMGRAARLG